MSSFIKSGLPAVDHYLEQGFGSIRGSSRFSVAVCSRLLARQSALGIGGSVAEFGLPQDEGRFFVAMGLALAEDEHAYGVEAYPTEFVANAAEHGLRRERFTLSSAYIANWSAAEFLSLTGGAPLRFIHIECDDSPEALDDLALARACLHESGLIVIDDWRRPPASWQVILVRQFLERHPDMRLLCAIKRGDIIGTATFVLCRAATVTLFENDLMASFKAQPIMVDATSLERLCLIVTPDHLLGDGGAGA